MQPNNDEKKLLQFQRLKRNETLKQKNREMNAQHIKNKLVTLASPVLTEMLKEDTEGARDMIEEQHRIEEEEKEYEIGRFMGQKDHNDESDTDSTDEVLSTPVLKQNPFLYLGFGINLYFDFLLTLMLTMGVI